MTAGYDQWKTEAYDRAAVEYERRIFELRRTALDIIRERDKYEAALRKIAEWKGYAPYNTAGRCNALTLYEEGANDMLATLKRMAEEELS